MLVDQGYQNYGGCQWVLKMYKKTVRAQQNPHRNQNPLLILGREDEKRGRVGDGHDLVEGVHRGLPLNVILLKLPLVI